MDQRLKHTGEGSVCSVRDFVFKVYGLGFGFRFQDRRGILVFIVQGSLFIVYCLGFRLWCLRVKGVEG